ncbi:MAG: CBS domain-containing protein [Gemmatimonadota bacterium]|nr:CBS domain-containing protein [Gemmatimonadota bacterium]
MKVKEIMTTELVTVTRDMTIRRFIKLLEKNNITGAPVVDEDGKLIGIVSGKDVIHAIDHLIQVHVSIDQQKEDKGRFNWVEGIMTSNVITCSEDDDVNEVFGTMVSRRIHRLPVVRDGKPVGIITSLDSCRFISGNV